ncbi:DUF3784 domain-containing protein [Syntrophomonas curvata]
MTELFINLFICALIFFSGVLIKYFKAYDLIAGYNTAPQEIRKQIDAKALGDFIGRQLMIAAFTPLLGYGLKQAGFLWGTEAGFGLLLIIIVYTAVKARKFSPPLPANRAAKISILVGLIITTAVGASIAWTALPSRFNLENGQFTISGAYGISAAYSSIEEIMLVPAIPSIAMKTNGLDMGPVLKGHFQLKDKRKALLFLRSADGPVLVIKRHTEDEIIMINGKNASETRSLYENLNNRLQPDEITNSGEKKEENPFTALSSDEPKISVDDFQYPSTYPKLEILCGKRQLAWVKGDSNFTGKAGGVIGNTMFGMNEEHTDLLEPNTVKPGSELVFIADAVPGLGNPLFELQLLDRDNSLSAYPLNKNTMLVPGEDGGYVFILSADWGNGDNCITYWFKVTVEK